MYDFMDKMSESDEALHRYYATADTEDKFFIELEDELINLMDTHRNIISIVKKVFSEQGDDMSWTKSVEKTGRV